MTNSNSRAVLPAPHDRAGPYSSSLLPGARDVQSTWGSIRVYEWGPVKGRKVLLIHGLSTPSPALADVGHSLVKEGGCRVMIFDLWGRGFSDAPLNLPHDARLYSTQILLVLASSSISWTGDCSNGFTIVGYSMGGALAMAFARWFPQLIHCVVLMAPGGLYPGLPSEYTALCIRHPWLFPNRYVKEYIRGLLNGTAVPSIWNSLFSAGKATTTTTPVLAEAQDRAALDVEKIVNWEIDHHPGFVYSVTNALRNAPVVRQYELWTQVRMHLEGTSSMELPNNTPNLLHGSKILLLLGKDDAVLHAGFSQDVERTIGHQNLEIHELEGGHSFPILHGDEVGLTILKFVAQRDRK